MTIFTELRVRQGGFLEDYEAPQSDVLGATAEEAFTFNPIPSIMRRRELMRAERGVGHNILDYNVFGDERPDTASSLVDAGTARDRIKEEGLNLVIPDSGIRERALELLIERKKDERRRQDILNRAPEGLLAGAERFGVSLATQAMDPLNIASAFIPVVGEARYASMLARAGGPMGRAAVRAGIGAAEGGVGAAVVEPLIYAGATAEQADYDLNDSLANIAFGTILGGGLHVGAGAVGDAVRGVRDWRTARAAPDAPIPRMMESVPSDVRAAALRTGIAQAVTGRELNIEPVVSYASRQGEFAEPLRASAGEPELPRVDAVTGVEGFTVYHGSPHTFDRFDMSKIGTGEGAQAYGHGLYFAENEGVAKNYATTLSPYGTMRLGGEPISIPQMEDGPRKMAAQLLLSKSFNGADARYAAKNALAESNFKGFTRDQVSDEIDKLLKDGARPVGSTYQVNISAHPDDFLDWDKPLSEQPKALAAIETAYPEYANLFKSDPHAANKQLGVVVKSLESNYGSEVSGRLREAGIPGIKYLDQGSRGTPNVQLERDLELAKLDGNTKEVARLQKQLEGQTRNFVIFDDKLIHPIRRNDEFIARQPQDLQSAAHASFAADQMRLYDGEAVRIADERIAAAPDDETMPDVSLQEALDDVARLVRTLDAGRVTAKPLKKQFPANPELKMRPRPVIDMLKRAGGVKPDSPLGGDLMAMGLTPKNTRGLFRKNGRGGADNFVASEHEIFSDRRFADEYNSYIPEHEIIEAIREELAGNPRRSPDELAEIERYKAIVDRIVNEGVVREEGPIPEAPPVQSAEEYGTYEAMVAQELAAFEELQATAEAYGRGIIAAADCRLRRS